MELTELTELGFALLLCSGLAVALFCWLTWASLVGPPSDHSTKRPRASAGPTA
ncbi:MAG: hypothetical protein JSR67_17135 [Proteobacteria bacterium]|nr:hypothetical protein [Pseudomonadota bacterium]